VNYSSHDLHVTVTVTLSHGVRLSRLQVVSTSLSNCLFHYQLNIVKEIPRNSAVFETEIDFLQVVRISKHGLRCRLCYRPSYYHWCFLLLYWNIKLMLSGLKLTFRTINCNPWT